MRKPTIDELLAHEHSIYTLTMLAAKRARQLKILDRESMVPLQVALDEIASGRVLADFSEDEVDDERLVEGLRRTEKSSAEEEELPPSAFDDDDDQKQPRLFPV
jgi:DNA-directed RNA polymerase omega subunit